MHLHLFDRRTWIFRQTKRAFYYLRKLAALRIVKIAVLAALLILLSPFVLFLILHPKVQPNINYGVTFSNRYATQLGLNWKKTYLEILDDLGAKNLRLAVYWDEVEKQPGVYDFTNIKWQLDEAKKRNLPVILVTGRKVIRYPECYEPAWWGALKSEQAKNNALYEFIRQTIVKLRSYPNIRMWQIENEPFFPFGDCALQIKWNVLKHEIEIVRSLDTRPILTQDSGEGGLWYPTYKLGDYLGISMYRRIWFDFWGLFLRRPIYFQYPLAHWTYKIKADLLRVPYDKMIVTELQGEPWGPKISSQLSTKEKNKTMSRNQFIDTINYAQKAGFKNLYFWGAEWWYFEKQNRDEPYYWDTAKALFN